MTDTEIGCLPTGLCDQNYLTFGDKMFLQLSGTASLVAHKYINIFPVRLEQKLLNS